VAVQHDAAQRKTALRRDRFPERVGMKDHAGGLFDNRRFAS
jgi:hypothetical protein